MKEQVAPVVQKDTEQKIVKVNSIFSLHIKKTWTHKKIKRIMEEYGTVKSVKVKEVHTGWKK